MPDLTFDIEWPVRTARLELRPASHGDLEASWSYRKLDAVSRWLTRSPQSFTEHAEHYGDPRSLAKTVVVEHRGRVVGDLMIDIGDGWSQDEVAERARGVQADLGWVFHPDATGRGLATEAVRAVLRICFEHLGLRRVVAECFAANESSWRLMERVGMRRESHTVRDALHRSGDWLDSFGYALLADDWSEI